MANACACKDCSGLTQSFIIGGCPRLVAKAWELKSNWLLPPILVGYQIYILTDGAGLCKHVCTFRAPTRKPFHWWCWAGIYTYMNISGPCAPTTCVCKLNIIFGRLQVLGKAQNKTKITPQEDPPRLRPTFHFGGCRMSGRSL